MNTSAPRKPCRKPGCNVLGTTSYCEAHTKSYKKAAKARRKTYDKERGSRHERGYDSRWDRAAKAYRNANPLCVMCERNGIVTPTQCVDHIVPHCGDQDLFWDVANWMSLCHACHSRKTATEDGGFGNRKR